MSQPLLEVKDLKVRFYLSERTVHAVNGVSFTVNEGQVVGIVGESGCGKSVTSLVDHAPDPETRARSMAGRYCCTTAIRPLDLLQLSNSEMERVRGNRISMIFQDPMTSLNPVLTIGYQLMEPLKLHRGLSDEEAQAEAVKLLDGWASPSRKAA